MSLKVNEIFFSIQGESTHAGEPCIFIRLTGCHLRCTYCDTEYAFHDGKKMDIQEILTEIKKFNCKKVEITGGEPMLQEEVIPLMSTLIKNGYSVLLETSGAKSLKDVPLEVFKIIDIKTPSSQMTSYNDWSNLNHLNTHDEIKFVIGNRADYEWSKGVTTQYNLKNRCREVLFSPTHGKLHPGILGDWIRKDNLAVKLQIQLHKYLGMP